MRILSIALALAGTLTPARATTLQKLGLDEIILKSTAIVRAKVLGSAGTMRGQDIYTCYQLQILEEFKSAGVRQMEVAVPGGSARGLRQIVAGAPVLNAGDEYVFFLWTSPSGLTQVIGLSQGLFNVERNAAGDSVVARRAATDLMLDKSGHVVSDQAVSMPLSELRARVQKTLSPGK
jgi:hypothetical protein